MFQGIKSCIFPLKDENNIKDNIHVFVSALPHGIDFSIGVWKKSEAAKPAPSKNLGSLSTAPSLHVGASALYNTGQNKTASDVQGFAKYLTNLTATSVTQCPNRSDAWELKHKNQTSRKRFFWVMFVW